MGSAASVRVALRSATEEVHERLHAARPFAAIAERRLCRAGYAALLRALHAFHAALEAACGDVWAGAPRAPGRVERIERDLAALGSAPSAAGGAWSLPPAPGAALGALYVAQGSVLGGRVIHRQLDYLFDGAEGRRFFAGSDADAPAWRSLCALLEREGRDPSILRGMRAGAEAAFARFERCLEEHCEEPVYG